jgi:hypothetical protein
VREYAGRALELDAMLGEAWYAFALPAVLNWRWEEASPAFERVVEVDPSRYLYHYWMVLCALARQ